MVTSAGLLFALLWILCCPFLTMARSDSCEASYCAGLRPDECYLNHEVCCQTCAQYETGVTGCKFGDRASICGLDFCNVTDNVEICCDTCRDVTTDGVSTTTVAMSTRVTSPRPDMTPPPSAAPPTAVVETKMFFLMMLLYFHLHCLSLC